MSKPPRAKLPVAVRHVADWTRPIPPAGPGVNELDRLKVRQLPSLNAGPDAADGVVAKLPTLSVFYGYPAELVARWCGVSVSTAAAWKANKRKPSRQALRIFTLHRDGRVLGDQWAGWEVREGVIRDPEGNCTTADQLRSYALILQLARELARHDPRWQADFERLLASA